MRAKNVIIQNFKKNVAVANARVTSSYGAKGGPELSSYYIFALESAN